jgi:hypothetical protein
MLLCIISALSVDVSLGKISKKLEIFKEAGSFEVCLCGRLGTFVSFSRSGDGHTVTILGEP